MRAHEVSRNADATVPMARRRVPERCHLNLDHWTSGPVVSHGLACQTILCQMIFVLFPWATKYTTNKQTNEQTNKTKKKYRRRRLELEEGLKCSLVGAGGCAEGSLIAIDND